MVSLLKTYIYDGITAAIILTSVAVWRIWAMPAFKTLEASDAIFYIPIYYISFIYWIACFISRIGTLAESKARSAMLRPFWAISPFPSPTPPEPLIIL